MHVNIIRILENDFAQDFRYVHVRMHMRTFMSAIRHNMHISCMHAVQHMLDVISWKALMLFCRHN